MSVRLFESLKELPRAELFFLGLPPSVKSALTDEHETEENGGGTTALEGSSRTDEKTSADGTTTVRDMLVLILWQNLTIPLT